MKLSTAEKPVQGSSISTYRTWDWSPNIFITMQHFKAPNGWKY